MCIAHQFNKNNLMHKLRLRLENIQVIIERKGSAFIGWPFLVSFIKQALLVHLEHFFIFHRFERRILQFVHKLLPADFDLIIFQVNPLKMEGGQFDGVFFSHCALWDFTVLWIVREPRDIIQRQKHHTRQGCPECGRSGDGSFCGLQCLYLRYLPLPCLINHPKFASMSEPIQTSMSKIPDAQTQEQMRVPLMLRHVLPVGLLGLLYSGYHFIVPQKILLPCLQSITAPIGLCQEKPAILLLQGSGLKILMFWHDGRAGFVTLLLEITFKHTWVLA